MFFAHTTRYSINIALLSQHKLITQEKNKNLSSVTDKRDTPEHSRGEAENEGTEYLPVVRERHLRPALVQSLPCPRLYSQSRGPSPGAFGSFRSP